MIFVTCTSCGTRVQVPEQLVGGNTRCPRCQTEQVVPAPSPAATVASAALAVSPLDSATLSPDAKLENPATRALSGSLPLENGTQPWFGEAAEQASGTATIPGYEILGELGRGGMGVVYKARHLKLHRLVALKMILAGSHAGTAERARFQTEGEAIARLQHANIVQVYEVGEHEGKPFFSLEFCGGGSLKEKLNGTPLAAREAAALVETLARAMQAAHAHQIIHRDLKPANVLLTEEGTPKITDFGLAKKLDEAGQTHSGDIMGTPSYMAPEQAGGKAHELGPLVDVYALGAILYECLTGRPPFKAATALDTLRQVMMDEPVAPTQLQPKTPRDLETISLKCLQKQPHKRYASAEALAEDLRRFQASEPIKARPVSVGERLAKWAKRRPAVAALVGVSATAVAVVLLVAGLGFGLVMWQWRQTETARQDATNRADAEALAKVEAQTAKQNALDEKVKGDAVRYCNQIQLAHQTWQDGHIVRSLELLDNWKSPTERQQEFRGWEWHYLRGLCSQDLRTFKAPKVDLVHVAISPDDRLLAAGGWSKNTVHLWEIATGREVAVFKEHTAAVHAVTFSPDGRLLASASDDGTVRVWEVDGGKNVATLKGRDPEHIRSVVFSPDGRYLATAVWELRVRLWDVKTWQEVKTFVGHTAQVMSVAFSPDGRLLASAGHDRVVRLWDVSTLQPAGTFQGEHRLQISTVAFSPDGKMLATGSEDQTIKLWDVATRKVRSTLRGHSAWVYDVAFSPDGQGLASAGDDELVKLWDLRTGLEAATFRGHQSNFVRGVAFSHEGRLLVSAGMDGVVKVWDPTMSSQEFRRLASKEATAVTCCVFSPDGRWLALAGRFRPLSIRATDDYREVSSTQVHTQDVWALAFTPDSHFLASASIDGTAKLVRVPDGQTVLTFRGHQGGVRSVAISPDGRQLATGGVQDKAVKMWDVKTGNLIRTLQGHQALIRSVAFSLDGQWLASASDDKTVRLWNVADGETLRTLQGHSASIWCVRFAPDGHTLASADESGRVILWDSASGAVLHTIRAHTTPVYGLTFHPREPRLVTAGRDQTVKLWDTSNGEEMLTLKGHESPVYCVAFTPDGRRLVSGAANGSILLWDSADEEGRQLPHLQSLYSPDQLLAWHQEQAGVCERSQNWFGVVFHLDRVLDGKPGEGKSILDRGNAHAELGHWEKAVADLAKAVELLPDDASAWQKLAVAYLGAGEREKYRKVCAELLQRFGNTNDAQIADQVLYPCVVLADAVPDPGRLVPIAQVAAPLAPGNVRALGAALYRAGKYELAAQRFSQSTKLSPPRAWDWLFLAMIHQRLGHAEQARDCLAKAVRWTEDAEREAAGPLSPDRPDAVSWNERLEIQHLRREAEALIEGKPADPNK